MDTLQWMLDSDPALRWQVERDLAGALPEVWEATRAKVATEGFGAELLSHQGDDGQWAGGAFFPAEFDQNADGQPWTATTPTLTMLREFGLDARVLDGTAEKLRANSRWEYDDLPYWDGEVDVCINASTLANGAWLGADVKKLRQWFLDHQLDDGGWNCEWVEGSTRSSFHSTLNALKGMLAYEQYEGPDPVLAASRRRGEEYLLKRRLLYRLSDGELVGTWVDKFAWPFRWFYSALNALDYFRESALHAGTGPDPRLTQAIDVVLGDRTDDGTWIQGRRHPGEVWIEVDVDAGEPSKWLTFHATRVLNWWADAGRLD